MLTLFVDDSAYIFFRSILYLEFDFWHIGVHEVTSSFLHLHGDDLGKPVVLKGKAIEPCLLID